MGQLKFAALALPLVAPSGTGTQVVVAVEPPAAPNAEGFDKIINQQPAIANMFHSIVSEQVDAGLTNRKFSFANIRKDRAVAMVAVLPEARQQMDDATSE